MKSSAALLVAALLTASLAPLSGCERKSEQAAPAPASLSVELRIAPVADAHPWVMALVTQTSITRPHGVDARLEGLIGPGGTRSPDPIIEAESLEDLQTWLESYEAMRPRPPELLPVWELDPFGPDNRVHARLYFLATEQGFMVDAEARARVEPHDYGPRVHLQLGAAQAQQLEELSGELIGHRLGVVMGQEALMLPLVMDPLVGGEVQLLWQTSRDPERTAPELLAKLTG